jgi:hypothetical protein
VIGRWDHVWASRLIHAPHGSRMSFGGSFMPLGALLCPLGFKCTPPLKHVHPPYVCAPWGSFKHFGIRICPFGLTYVPWGLIYAPWDFFTHLGTQVFAPFSSEHAPPPMHAYPGALLSPLGLIYIPWGLIYAPWDSFMPFGAQVCPPLGVRTPLGVRAPSGVCASSFPKACTPSLGVYVPSQACTPSSII